MLKSFAISRLAATAAVFVLGLAATGAADAGPVPPTSVYYINANSGNGPHTESKPPIAIPANSNIRAHVMLNQVINDTGQNSFAASVYISQYVQNGVAHSGYFFELHGSNITEIVLTATVSNANVWGTLLLEYF